MGHENYRKIVHECEIVSIKRLNQLIFSMELFSREIAESCYPGQFVNIDAGKFLRRPISISGINKEEGTFSLGIKIVGSGTANLSKLKPGNVVSVQGPLGKGFSLDGTKNIIVVGGGVGIFPLIFLLDEARKKNIRTQTVCGYASEDVSFCTSEISTVSDFACFASDRGDMQFHGNAAQAFMETCDLKGAVVYTCGPAVMMKAVADFCKGNSIECFVSLEERMGCGSGICLTCAVKIKSPDGDYDYKRCCYDGPVFNAEDVVWE